VQEMPHQIQIEDDLLRVFGQAADRHLEQRLFNLLRVVRDLMETSVFVIAQLQSVEGAGGGQSDAFILQTIPSQRIGFARRDRQERIQPQGGMIVEVFVTQSHGVQALGDQLWDGMINEKWMALIAEALGQGAGNPQAPVDLAEEQGAAVRTEVATGKVGLDAAGSQVIKEERLIQCEHAASL